MVRPRKIKFVNFEPDITYFKPRAVPLNQLEEVEITIDELETLRLSNLKNMNQSKAASKMKIHQSTFHRTMARAMKKITDALVNGKAIKIGGGNFEMAVRRFRCNDGHEWDVPFENLIANPPVACPKCRTPDILTLQPGYFGGRGRHRGGRGRR